MQRDLIIDCQFGSTGKGLFCGYLAERRKPQVIAFAPSPNAGHTLTYGEATFIHKMLPTGFTSPDLETVCLGPGSLLDLGRLQDEITVLEAKMPRFRDVEILVHQNAACVLDRHRQAEANGGTAPGSTRQGAGAAQAERILRSPLQANIIRNLDHPVLKRVRLVDTAGLQRAYTSVDRIQIESCQGYSLSVYHGMYPHTTSRDVTTASVLSDTGVPWTHSLNVYGTFRLYPIRVAHRPADGEDSGPTYPDSKEITFDEIGQPQEFTTVTKLPRRLFTWSQQQAIEACVQNRISHAFLNFCNYAPKFEILNDVWERLSECTNVTQLGFGSSISDIRRVGAPIVERDHIRRIYEQCKHS